MTGFLWQAAALGLLGVPAAATTLFVWIYFGVGTAMGRYPRAEAWFARRGWARAYEIAQVLWFFVAGAAAFVLSAAAAVGVPAGLAWWLWRDTEHATVAGLASAAPLVAYFAFSGWLDWRRRARAS